MLPFVTCERICNKSNTTDSTVYPFVETEFYNGVRAVVFCRPLFVFLFFFFYSLYNLFFVLPFCVVFCVCISPYIMVIVLSVLCVIFALWYLKTFDHCIVCPCLFTASHDNSSSFVRHLIAYMNFGLCVDFTWCCNFGHGNSVSYVFCSNIFA